MRDHVRKGQRIVIAVEMLCKFLAWCQVCRLLELVACCLFELVQHKASLLSHINQVLKVVFVDLLWINLFAFSVLVYVLLKFV